MVTLRRKPASPDWPDTQLSASADDAEWPDTQMAGSEADADVPPAPVDGHDTGGTPIQEKARGRRPKPAAAGPSLLQRLLGRKSPPADDMPHSTFCETAYGVRSAVVAGQGSPVVVFEAGLGHGKRSWGSVFNPVSEFARCVAYDRAGYGQSEAALTERDGVQVVRELRGLLQSLALAPPYVLVGHSLGGTYMKLFAKMFPEETAGVVLVDARHSEFTQRCRQLGVPRLLYRPPEALLKAFSPTARAELLAAPVTLKQARKAGPFPSVPLLVLTQNDAIARWPGGLGTVWAASQRDLAKMSKLGRLKVLDDSGHNVHLDRPEVVVRAILNVVRAGRYLKHQALKKAQ